MWACNVIWTFRINPTARKIFVITGQFSSDLVSNEESYVTFIHPLVTWFQVSCLDQSFLDNRGEYSRTSWQIKPHKDLRRVVGNMANKLGHLTIDICYGKGMASKLQNIYPWLTETFIVTSGDICKELLDHICYTAAWDWWFRPAVLLHYHTLLTLLPQSPLPNHKMEQKKKFGTKVTEWSELTCSFLDFYQTFDPINFPIPASMPLPQNDFRIL